MEVFEHPGDPLFWFWCRVGSLGIYFLIAASVLAESKGCKGYDLLEVLKGSLIVFRNFDRNSMEFVLFYAIGISEC